MADENSTMMKLKEFYAAHPAVDHVLPMLALLIWWLAFGFFVPRDVEGRQWAYAAVSTVSGLTLAASTFACTMTYQSDGLLIVRARRKYGALLKRNWVAILRSTILTAFFPIAALLVEASNSTVAFGLVIYAAILLSLRFYRSIFWLSLTLFFVEKSPHGPPPVAPPLYIPKTTDTNG